MDYGRFNYVAQPGDGAPADPDHRPLRQVRRRVGLHASSRAPRPTTTRRRSSTRSSPVSSRTRRSASAIPTRPRTRRSRPRTSAPTRSRRPALGLKNIDRVAGFLVKATAKKGENYDQLRNMYTELGHQRKPRARARRQPGRRLRRATTSGTATATASTIPSPQRRQREAVRFLNENAFQVPPALVAPEIVDRLESHGAADRILDGQRSLLRIAPGRARGSAGWPNSPTAKARTPISRPTCSTTSTPASGASSRSESVEIDLYRRNLQRAFVEILIGDLDPPRTNSDLTALARGELQRTLREIAENLNKSRDTTSRYHLADVQARITQALEPRIKTPAPGQPRVASDSDGS